MNYKMIFYTLGSILKVIGALLLLPLIVSFVYNDGYYYCFLTVIVISLVLGFSLTLIKPDKEKFFMREGLAVTGLSWILISLVGCLPFVISQNIPSFIDAFFETVSGFTTTGASILSDVESLAPSMIFWRSLTHWIGGMGILIFIISILPSKAQNIHIMKSESPGPKVGKLVSKVKVTARILYIIYTVLTLIEVIFLICGGMPFFDAICISLGTAGTGGFAITNAGIGAYSIYSQVVIGVFMLLFGVNFNVYYLLLLGKIKDALKSEEVKTYFIIVFTSIVLITLNICLVQKISDFTNIMITTKDSFFQVAAIITTTGFATVDFTLWPVFSQVILFMLMFVGACAGSTGGGMKVSRIIILVKNIRRNIKEMVHPHSVNNIFFEGEKIEDEQAIAVSNYVSLIFIMFLVATLIVSIDGKHDLVTNVTAVASCINNIGPGLGAVGPMGNYGDYSILSKLVFIVSMLIGRLEIFPIIVLFSPKLWKNQ